MKSKTRRDGWRGAEFKRLRQLAERSASWIAARTGVSARQVENYEANRIFPPHRWRDAAALALQIDRRTLGVEGD